MRLSAENQHLLNKLMSLANIDLTPTIAKGCIVVENKAKELCPVDTGELRSSITHTVNEENHVFVGDIGTNTLYAPFVCFGTGLWAEAGDGRKDVPWRYKDREGKWHSTVGQHPQPFLRPAFNQKREEVARYIMDRISEEIKK